MSSWSILIESEISSTIFTLVFKKISKSNNLIFLIIQKTYKIISKLFFMIFSCLINNEIYSHCWRTDIDAILKKIEKSNYFMSKSYRIITLLNCLKKISKKSLLNDYCIWNRFQICLILIKSINEKIDQQLTQYSIWHMIFNWF